MSKELWDEVKNLISNHSLKLGPYFSYQTLKTPRHILFSLSHYKFAARMLPRGDEVTVLELGCNEGICTLILAEQVKKVVAVDFDEEAIKYAQTELQETNISFVSGNFLNKKFGLFDAVVSLDVIEHIAQSDEEIFFKTIIDNLKNQGVFIVGTPNETSNQYASEITQKGHINLFSADRLYNTMSQYFQNVFLFGMNDEILHTGFYPMCHYLLAIGCNMKKLDT